MSRHAGPSENAAWPPYTSGSNVSWSRSAVIKRYPGKPINYFREHAVLSRLAVLAVPKILPGSRPGELHLAYVDGVDGREAIGGGGAGRLLEEMGKFLRELHQIDVKSVSDSLDGEGSVIVHGDFAHYNCLMSTDGARLAAVLDWECAHLGDKIEDLAWLEFQFKNSYPEHGWAMSNLFEGYGEEPSTRLREERVAQRIEELRLGPVQRARPYHLLRFESVDESAAFVAALSRVLNSPQVCRDLRCGAPEVWLRSAGSELCLNDQAMVAATGAFGTIRVSGLIFEGVGQDCDRLLLSGDRLPSWGFDEARQRA